MPRVTDTRERVRALANRIAQEGGKPNPTLIRQMLGGGSPNTIVDELKKWAGERATPTSPAKETAGALERIGMLELSNVLKEALAQNQKQQEFLHQASVLLASAKNIPDILSGLTKQFQKVSDQMSEDRTWMERELHSVNTRFEGVQRYMLLQVNEAREEATKWKENHSSVKGEFYTWQCTLEQKNASLLEEVTWLKGKLGLPPGQPGFSAETRKPTLSTGKKSDFSAEIAATSPSIAATSTYPGHPRAVTLPDDS